MFKLSLKSGGKKISYKNLSVSVRYFIDEKKIKESLKNFERFQNKIIELQRKIFSNDSIEIRVLRSNGKPDEMLLVKVKLDDKFNSDYFRNHLLDLFNLLKRSSKISSYFHSKSYSC
jgi:hypothetical protein